VPENLRQLPMRTINFNNAFEKEAYNKLVEGVAQIMKIRSANPQADISSIEDRIDELVYALYGLREKEIELVEGLVKEK